MSIYSSLYNTRAVKDTKLFFNRLKDGEPGAWLHIYNDYYTPLCNFALGLIKNEMEAEDIALETFCKLWRLIDRFDNIYNLRAYLYVTVRNACFDYLRHYQLTLKAHKKIYLNSITYELPYEGFIDDTAPGREELIGDCINELPEKAQRIFKMYYYDELSTAQIAGTLGMTEQAVRNNKTRAVDLLKDMLFSKNGTLG